MAEKQKIKEKTQWGGHYFYCHYVEQHVNNILGILHV